jgi:beta-lactamase superfamily II metal-dependent hydrolase
VLATNLLNEDEEANPRSIVLKITYKTFDVMLTGDATSETDDAIIELYHDNPQFLDVEV